MIDVYKDLQPGDTVIVHKEYDGGIVITVKRGVYVESMTLYPRNVAGLANEFMPTYINQVAWSLLSKLRRMLK
jgi:hypothetical protein